MEDEGVRGSWKRVSDDGRVRVSRISSEGDLDDTCMKSIH